MLLHCQPVETACRSHWRDKALKRTIVIPIRNRDAINVLGVSFVSPCGEGLLPYVSISGLKYCIMNRVSQLGQPFAGDSGWCIFAFYVVLT
jgi:hypothetical protein